MPEVLAVLVLATVFKTGVGLNKVPGGFDSHPPPPLTSAPSGSIFPSGSGWLQSQFGEVVCRCAVVCGSVGFEAALAEASRGAAFFIVRA